MLKEDALGYEDIALNVTNVHRLKDIVQIANGSIVVAVIGKLTTIK
jgi:hypothetical protein